MTQLTQYSQSDSFEEAKAKFKADYPEFFDTDGTLSFVGSLAMAGLAISVSKIYSDFWTKKRRRQEK